MNTRILTLKQLYAIVSREHNKEFYSLACTPNDEKCTQAGGNFADQKIECKVLINQFRRQYGPEPEGSEFIIIENFHEFGTYYEAGILYEFTPEPESYNEDTDIETDLETPAQLYANKVENIPDNWDFESIAELRQLGHSQHQPAKVIKMRAA